MSIAAARVLAGGPLPSSSARAVADHAGHGCCGDPDRRRWRGDTSGTVALVGTGERSRPAGLGLTDARETYLVATAVPLRCRTWRCRCCAVRLMRRNRARAFMGASGARIALVTLTVDPEDPRFQEAVQYYRDAGAGGPDGVFPVASIDYVRTVAWKRFRTYLAREYGRVPWLRGLELTKAGIAHVHVLVRVRDAAEFLALRSLIRGAEGDRASRRGAPRSAGAGLAERAGFGIVSDVQLAKASGDVARYVTKLSGAGHLEDVGQASAYATKGIGDGRMPKYTRRASWSGGEAAWAPGWRKPTPLAGFTWRVAAAAPARVLQGLRASGYVIEDPGLLRVMAGGSAPPERG